MNLLHKASTYRSSLDRAARFPPSLLAIFNQGTSGSSPTKYRYIKGVQTETKHHKINLYADDVLPFFRNLKTSLMKTITLIEKFSSATIHFLNISNFHTETYGGLVGSEGLDEDYCSVILILYTLYAHRYPPNIAHSTLSRRRGIFLHPCFTHLGVFSPAPQVRGACVSSSVSVCY